MSVSGTDRYVQCELRFAILSPGILVNLEHWIRRPTDNHNKLSLVSNDLTRCPSRINSKSRTLYNRLNYQSQQAANECTSNHGIESAHNVVAPVHIFHHRPDHCGGGPRPGRQHRDTDHPMDR